MVKAVARGARAKVSQAKLRVILESINVNENISTHRLGHLHPSGLYEHFTKLIYISRTPHHRFHTEKTCLSTG